MQRSRKVMLWLVAALAATAVTVTSAAAQAPLDVVVGNNFGHLPMFVGGDKGLFRQHGVDVRLKGVNTGTDRVHALPKRDVQTGELAVTNCLEEGRDGR